MQGEVLVESLHGLLYYDSIIERYELSIVKLGRVSSTVITVMYIMLSID